MLVLLVLDILDYYTTWQVIQLWQGEVECTQGDVTYNLSSYSNALLICTGVGFIGVIIDTFFFTQEVCCCKFIKCAGCCCFSYAYGMFRFVALFSVFNVFKVSVFYA